MTVRHLRTALSELLLFSTRSAWAGGRVRAFAERSGPDLRFHARQEKWCAMVEFPDVFEEADVRVPLCSFRANDLTYLRDALGDKPTHVVVDNGLLQFRLAADNALVAAYPLDNEARLVALGDMRCIGSFGKDRAPLHNLIATVRNLRNRYQLSAAALVLSDRAQLYAEWHNKVYCYPLGSYLGTPRNFRLSLPRFPDRLLDEYGSVHGVFTDGDALGFQVNCDSYTTYVWQEQSAAEELMLTAGVIAPTPQFFERALGFDWSIPIGDLCKDLPYALQDVPGGAVMVVEIGREQTIVTVGGREAYRVARTAERAARFEARLGDFSRLFKGRQIKRADDVSLVCYQDKLAFEVVYRGTWALLGKAYYELLPL